MNVILKSLIKKSDKCNFTKIKKLKLKSII